MTNIPTVSLKCLECGASLRIGASIVEFACEYCGTSQIVEREGGIVALHLLSGRVDRIQTTVDRTAAEVTIARLKDELEDLEDRYEQMGAAFDEAKGLYLNGLFIGLGSVLFILGGTLFYSPILGIIVVGSGAIIVFTLWQRKSSEMKRVNEWESKRLIEKGAEIKKEILRLKRTI